MTLPFDIKYRDKIESGEYKVKTADGRNVRIICSDKKTDGTKSGAEQIVALVSRSNGLEKTLHYNKYGKCMASGMSECPKDLFLVTPEEELTPFEKALSFTMGFIIDDMQGDRYDIVKHIKESAKELLKLARIELKDKNYEYGFIDGKAEALNDLPRWKKCEEDSNVAMVYNCAKREDSLLYYKGHTIKLIDLERLPKDDSHE